MPLTNTIQHSSFTYNPLKKLNICKILFEPGDEPSYKHPDQFFYFRKWNDTFLGNILNFFIIKIRAKLSSKHIYKYQISGQI